VRTREVYNGKEVFITATFKDFRDAEECVKYLVDRWYRDYKGYNGVNRAKNRREAAYLLQKEGYATDPVYAKLLIDLMDQNQPETTVNDYFLETASFYDKQEDHQIRAWRELEDDLTEEQLERFKRSFRNKTAAPSRPKFPLEVEYFYQLDSTTGHAERSCFSSSMAMALEYVNPSLFEGMDDDDYLQIVLKYGDTISSTAQLEAASSLGYDVEFFTNGSEQDLVDMLNDNTPVPIGILHKGPVSHPSGGGHWICLTGVDETHFWVNDPFGEMDVVRGGYVSTSPYAGSQIRYTRKNLMKRWLIDGSGKDGWGMYVKR
ncbi:MAG TPA: hypothetical protein DCW74_03125, partial [Alteromonas australica]|nr:hypothetical protein [Alteromonas australica]